MIEETLKGIKLTEESRERRIQDYVDMLKNLAHELQGDLYHRDYHLKLRTEAYLRWKGYFDNTSPIEGESHVHEAWRRIVIEGMGVDERFSEIIEENDNLLVFRSRNFCPILEACRELRLDARVVCELIYELPVELISGEINPNLRFTRDYECLRRGEKGRGKDGVHGQPRTTAHHRHEQAGEHAVILVLQRSCGIHARHRAAKAHEHGHKALAMQAERVHEPIHHERRAGHIARVLQQGQEKVEEQEQRHEYHHATHAGDHPIYH